ncbi:MAG: AMP-binding protein, partial [Alphaproteobacteria bacterium]
YHDMGLMGGILYPLLCGGVSFQMSPFDFVRRPGVWLSVIDEARATFSGGPAFAFAEVIRRVSPDEIAALDLSCWRRAFCGAEPVPPRLLDDFHAHLAPSGLPRAAVFACYGIAEMTLFAAGRPDDAKLGTSGSEHSESCLLDEETGAGVSIVDPETGVEMPEGQEGEIWLRGPSQGLGYLNLPEETDQRFRQRRAGETADAWLRTGDLGRVSHGRLFITGRLKDVLICQGRKLSAPEVEWLACAAHEGLNPMAAVAFMPDPNVSGRAVLVAETHRGALAPEDASDLKRKIRQSVLGEWGLELTDILFVPRGRLDRTTSGKIRRQAVAAAYRDGRLTTSAEEEGEPWQ